MTGIAFTVTGIPIPKQSTRFDGHGHAHTDPRVKGWADKVWWTCVKAMTEADYTMIDGDVKVELCFTLPNRRRVDADNLSKNVLDALNGLLWRDDSQVTDLTIKKLYKGDPGVSVAVWPKTEV